MAWPANGTTGWNTAMKAYIDVGHDSDGTHKKSQMLTDMAWSPTTYAGEESITFPNGLIMKTGEITRDGTSTAVVFSVSYTAFSTLMSIQVTGLDNGALNTTPAIDSESVLGFTIKSGSGVDSFYWTALGY